MGRCLGSAKYLLRRAHLIPFLGFEFFLRYKAVPAEARICDSHCNAPTHIMLSFDDRILRQCGNSKKPIPFGTEEIQIALS